MFIDCSSTNESFICNTNLDKSPNNFYNANYEKCPSLRICIEGHNKMSSEKKYRTAEAQHSSAESGICSKTCILELTQTYLLTYKGKFGLEQA